MKVFLIICFVFFSKLSIAQESWQLNLKEFNYLYNSSFSQSNDYLLNKGYSFREANEQQNGKGYRYSFFVNGKSTALIELRYYSNNTKAVIFMCYVQSEFLNLKKQVENAGYKLIKDYTPNKHLMGFKFNGSNNEVLIQQDSSELPNAIFFIMSTKGISKT